MLKTDGITADVVVPSEYWKVHGPAPVNVTVMFVDEPVQIAVDPEIVPVGLGSKVTLTGCGMLVQVLAELDTVMVAL